MFLSAVFSQWYKYWRQMDTAATDTAQSFHNMDIF